MTAAALATLPAVVTRLSAWQWLLEAAKLRGNLRLHLLFGSLSAAMIFLLWRWHARLRQSPEQRLTAVYLAAALIAVFLVALTPRERDHAVTAST